MMSLMLAGVESCHVMEAIIWTRRCCSLTLTDSRSSESQDDYFDDVATYKQTNK